jgi:hypothetical protein
MIQVDDAGIVPQIVALVHQNSINRFKASEGLFTGFKKRHKVVVRMVTTY